VLKQRNIKSRDPGIRAGATGVTDVQRNPGIYNLAERRSPAKTSIAALNLIFTLLLKIRSLKSDDLRHPVLQDLVRTHLQPRRR
jgi:hypothetical protein